MRDSMVPRSRNVYGHQYAGRRWERPCEKVLMDRAKVQDLHPVAILAQAILAQGLFVWLSFTSLSAVVFMPRKGWTSMEVPNGWFQVLIGPRPPAQGGEGGEGFEGRRREPAQVAAAEEDPTEDAKCRSSDSAQGGNVSGRSGGSGAPESCEARSCPQNTWGRGRYISGSAGSVEEGTVAGSGAPSVRAHRGNEKFHFEVSEARGTGQTGYSQSEGGVGGGCFPRPWTKTTTTPLQISRTRHVSAKYGFRGVRVGEASNLVHMILMTSR